MSEKTLYKVLVDGKSCHGGKLVWSLPKDGKPGEWHEVSGDIAMCHRGLHLTDEPYARWWKWGAAVYEAEAEGIVAWDGDKCVCRRARLLREEEEPFWLGSSVSFVESIGGVPWFRRVAPPDASWRVFPSRSAAWAAAGDAARDAASDAAWDAARSAAWAAAGDAARAAAWAAAWAAALLAQCLIVQDIIDPKHLDHVLARWRVWEQGYGLLCDVGGVLYVYEKP